MRIQEFVCFGDLRVVSITLRTITLVLEVSENYFNNMAKTRIFHAY